MRSWKKGRHFGNTRNRKAGYGKLILLPTELCILTKSLQKLSPVISLYYIFSFKKKSFAGPHVGFTQSGQRRGSWREQLTPDSKWFLTTSAIAYKNNNNNNYRNETSLEFCGGGTEDTKGSRERRFRITKAKSNCSVTIEDERQLVSLRWW